MAEGLLRQWLERKNLNDIQVLSAGTSALPGFGPTPQTIEVMKREKIDVSRHITQEATPALIEHADLILCMEEGHLKEILSMAPQAQGKVHLLRAFAAPFGKKNPNLNIPDPIGRPDEVYESCFLTIKEAVERVARWLEKQK